MADDAPVRRTLFIENQPGVRMLAEPAHSSSEIFDHPRIDDEEKLPFTIRLRVIVGMVAALWALIGVATSLVFR